MKLVIDIPEEQYITLNAKSQEEVLTVIDVSLLIKAIKNGTPLPKGHGRLIDADVLVDGMEDDYEFCEAVNATPTIIEADGGDADAGSD